MSLRTNYKNDKFAGKRKYHLINNSDGTISLDDVTGYEETGDIFNADDINSTNRAVNETVDGFAEVRKENSQFQGTMAQNFASLQSSVNQAVQNINQVVQDVKKARTIVLPASGWSNSAPYTQTKSISGITNQDTPTIALVLTGTLSAESVKGQRKAFGYLDRAVTGAGAITFYCYEKRPITDFSVQVKGE